MRCEVCWMICVLFRVSVSVFRSPSSSPEPFYIFVFSPVHLNRPPSPFTELFHRDYSALFIRFVSQPRSPQPFYVPVSSIVLRPRSPSEPYRDAFAASDAEVNET